MNIHRFGIETSLTGPGYFGDEIGFAIDIVDPNRIIREDTPKDEVLSEEAIIILFANKASVDMLVLRLLEYSRLLKD